MLCRPSNEPSQFVFPASSPNFGKPRLLGKRSSMSAILLKIKHQTGEAIFPATQRGKFIR
jgi:hypothetical protein